ncbi:MULTISPECIES: glycosyltransferase family 2 protein [Chitinophagaceae]
MKFEPKVSICIPTYNQPAFLERLLQSILDQTYKNVEVIISDDSNTDAIEKVYLHFKEQLNIQYFHHRPALKTPMNWNFALDKATGDFLMLIHQDDWLATMQSIEKYIQAAELVPNASFFFSKNTPRLLDGSVVDIQTNYDYIGTLEKNPYRLVKTYVIGPPSNIMVRKSVTTRYDERLIWLVDVDYCVRTIEQGNRVYFIDETLINIGMHPEQTTVFCNNNPEIVLRENILYSDKIPLKAFKEIELYDYFWRLIRNHKVRRLEDIYTTGVQPEQIKPIIQSMVNFQKKFSLSLLRKGIVSKSLMFLHYISHFSLK